LVGVNFLLLLYQKGIGGGTKFLHHHHHAFAFDSAHKMELSVLRVQNKKNETLVLSIQLHSNIIFIIYL